MSEVKAQCSFHGIPVSQEFMDEYQKVFKKHPFKGYGVNEEDVLFKLSVSQVLLTELYDRQNTQLLPCLQKTLKFQWLSGCQSLKEYHEALANKNHSDYTNEILQWLSACQDNSLIVGSFSDYKSQK